MYSNLQYFKSIAFVRYLIKYKSKKEYTNELMIGDRVIWDGLRTLNKISNDVNQHINFIMQETKDQFYRTAPSRIL